MKRIFSFLILFLLCGASGAGVAQPPSSSPILVIDSGGHTSNITGISFTGDGKQLVSVGTDKVIRVWDVATGKTVRTIRGEIGEGLQGRIFAAALSRDDKYLAVGGSFPGTGDERFAIRVYEFQTGRLLKLLAGHRDMVMTLAFSPNGQRLASGANFADKSVKIWDVAGWQLVGGAPQPVTHEDRVTSVAFSPDGLWVASGSSDANIKLWDATTGKWVKDLAKKHTDNVLAVAFSPDGRWLVSGDFNKRILLWNAKTGSFDKELGQMPDEIRSLTFPPNAADKSRRLLVGAKGGHTALISLPDGEIKPGYKHDDTVLAAAFSPDARVAATAGGYNNEIAFWSANDMTSRGKLVGGGRAVMSVGFARDGSSIAFGTQSVSNRNTSLLEQVIQLKQADGEYRVALAGTVKNEADYFKAITKHEDYELRLAGNGRIVIDKMLQIFKGGKPLAHNIFRSQNAHRSFTFTHDGQYIVSGAVGGYLDLYERDTGRKVIGYFGHTNDVLSVAVSPDDRYLVSGSSDQTVKIWDLRTGHNLLTFYAEPGGEWVAWTPQGYYTSSFHGDKLIGWQVNRGVTETPEYYTAAQFRASFNRPDVIGWLLVLRNIDLAVRQANAGSGGRKASGNFMSQQSYLGADIVRHSLPPTIEVLAPARKDMVSESQTVKLKARVLSQTLPITSVRVLLNGFSKGTFRGRPDDKEQGLRMEFEMAVGLEQGCNVLVIIASNDKASSKPEVLHIGYGAQKEKCGEDEKKSRSAFEVEPPRPALPEGEASLFRPAGYRRTDNLAGRKSMSVAFDRAAPGITARTFTTKPRAAVALRQADAPRINIVEPLETVKVVQNKNLTVALELPRGIPSAEVRILHDGREEHKIPLTGGWEGEVVLKPGLNKVTIIATYPDNTSDTVEREITFNAPADPRPRLIFLGIGIRTYDPTIRPKLDSLQFADNDAVELGKWVCRQGGENSAFAEVKAKVISNKDVTRAAILAGLRWMNEQVKTEKDVRVLLISGHGIVKEEDDQYYFYTSEQRGTEDPEELSVHWRVFWNKLRAKKSPALFLVDTCRAGGVAPRELVLEENLDGIVFLASSNGHTPSVEFPELRHGVFTKKILDGLNGEADKLDVNRLIDDGELAEWAKREVSKATSQLQKPVHVRPKGLDNFTISSTFPRPDTALPARCPEGVNQ